ncbi:MAG: hypothetical protein K2X82_10280 [Gemmataceae bacterium]|nr:hypothetical protein [Gemmataceae bacterium]
MFRVSMVALIGGLLVASGGLVGQDAKKDDAKPGKKDEPAGKVKGTLPPNWGKIGLTDDQKQEVYKVQTKYNGEIEKLEGKIKELKTARDKEMRAVLTADQKKTLQDLFSKKGG